MATLNREDVTLLALALARGRPLTRIYLQKAVYILQQELPKEPEVSIVDPYTFLPSHFGAYTPLIYGVALSFAQRGYIAVEDIDGNGWPFRFTALQKGVREGLTLLLRLPPYLRSRARGFVEWVEAFPTVTSLASAVYDLYPESAVNTVLDYTPPGPDEPIRRLDAIRPAELFSPSLNTLRWIRSVTGLEDSAIAALVGTSTDMLSLWREGYPVEESDERRIQDISALLKQAEKSYPTPSKLRAWLSTTQGTSIKSPRELISEGNLDTARLLIGASHQTAVLDGASPKARQTKAYTPVRHQPTGEMQVFYQHQGRKKPRRFQLDE